MEQIDISADDLILFATIVEQETLVSAAEFLGMPKATVSRRLAKLEAALGQRLLLRTTRRLSLTEFGTTFLDHCRRVAEEVGVVRDFVQSQELRPRGRLRVSMPGDYAKQNFAPAIATFIEAYPEIQLDLDLSTRRVDLIAERYDLAIRMGKLADDSSMVARKIDEQSFGLYASPIYLALHPQLQHPEQLQYHSTVRLLSARGSAAGWKLLRDKEVWEGVPPGRLSVSSPDMVQQLVLNGAGIGALPDRFARPDVQAKRLVRVLADWCFPPVPAWAVMPMRRYLPIKTRVFLEHIERHIEKG